MTAPFTLAYAVMKTDSTSYFVDISLSSCIRYCYLLDVCLTLYSLWPQLPKARRLELQAKQLAAAYEQLAADSEKHINALQRNLAVAVDERKQAVRQLDLCQVQLSAALKEKATVEADNVHLKIKVQQLEEETRALREANRLAQVRKRGTNGICEGLYLHPKFFLFCTCVECCRAL